ncbi:Na+/H+ antiporter subunit E [Anaplasma phagocytophilum]|uniref:Na+/H+ antiporter subunit E n=1 Tax=Anaplasma phagocytophilum TaxID=948 RepID=UPI00201A3462
MGKLWSCIVQMSLWLIFSGYSDWFFIASGVISSVSSVLLCSVLEKSVPREHYKMFPSFGIGRLRLAKNFCLYCAWLLCQVIGSSVYVTKRVFGPCVKHSKPVVAYVDTSQRSGLGAFMLVNSITLTPGTVGMSIASDGKVKVLALDKTLLSGVSEIDSKIYATFNT